MTRRLSSRDREKLYDAEAAKAAASGRGPHPICNICDAPIDGVRQDWDESHDPVKPRWLGGLVTGIAHRRCNRRHNNEHDTPLFAKGRRVRQYYIGARVAGQPMQASRTDRIKQKMDGTIVDRDTGRPMPRTPVKHINR